MEPSNSQGSRTPPRTAPTSGSVLSEKSITSPPPPSAHIGRARTEVPRPPPTSQALFQKTEKDTVPVGNRTYELSLKLEQRLGHFLTREQLAGAQAFFAVNVNAFRTAVTRTTSDALRRLIRMKGYIEDLDINRRVFEVTDQLTDGVMLLLYHKLRVINAYHPTYMERFYLKPRVPANFEVPRPWALAIQQLGVVEVSSLTRRRLIIPTATVDETTNLFVSANRIWRPAAYLQAVEYAKSVGLEFSSIDLHVKLGSAWWLFRPTWNMNYFTLELPLPEDNFTEADAMMYAMFCYSMEGISAAPLAALDDLGPDNYGTMLRNPPIDINVLSFLANAGAVDETLYRIA